jgi:hypothetical protein
MEKLFALSIMVMSQQGVRWAGNIWTAMIASIKALNAQHGVIKNETNHSIDHRNVFSINDSEC